MAARCIDIHPHIISDDTTKYARVPLFGVPSDWSKDRPVTIEGLVAAMDEAGVDQAAVVQSSTCYGYDNSYVVDAIAKYPGRFTAVGSVADGATVRISCQRTGQSIRGTYGTSTLWDYIGSGYVSDAYGSTGSDGRVAPTCR